MQAPRTPTPLESHGYYANQPVWPTPLVIDTYEFPQPLLSELPLRDSRDAPSSSSTAQLATRSALLGSPAAAGAEAAAAAAQQAGQPGPSVVASRRTNPCTKALLTAPAEVEEDLPMASVYLSRTPSVTRRTHNEVVARKPSGARRPSYEALHAAVAQLPSMSLPDKGSRCTPPEARDAAAKLAQATWDAAHKAATAGPAILAPVNQRRRVSLREAMRVMPAEERVHPDSPSRPPTLLSSGDSPRIKHGQFQTQCHGRPSSARAEADWQANTVMHVRRARVVCQEAQSRLMRIGSQDGPVFSRLYDDHLNRMDRFERHKAKVQPLSSKLHRD